jgi:hypothetical protein
MSNERSHAVPMTKDDEWRHDVFMLVLEKLTQKLMDQTQLGVASNLWAAVTLAIDIAKDAAVYAYPEKKP